MPEIRCQEVACNLCDKNETAQLFTSRSFNVVKCRNCGLVYLNPMPCAEDIARVYDARDYYCNRGSSADTPLGYPDYLKLKEHHNFVADELLRPLTCFYISWREEQGNIRLGNITLPEID